MIKNLVSLSFSVIMLLAGCSVAGSVVVTPTATLTPPPAATATLTPLPSDTPTPTPSQPVYYKAFSYSSISIGGSSEDVDISGVVCSLEQPFTLTDLKQPVTVIDSGRVTGVYQFTPSSPKAGSVSMAGLYGGLLPYNADGNYTVEDSKSDPTIPEGNLRLNITTQACPQMSGQPCFPVDYLIDLTPLDTNECSQP
ncbi:MAG: hypothetical protein WC832_07005 [Anaerolineales bacterium]